MCTDDSASPQPQANRERPKFTCITEVLETAKFVEGLLQCEREWVANRLLWLFTSQSFLVLAIFGFVARQTRHVGDWVTLAAYVGVPAIGILTSILGGLGIIAAHHEAARLANIRADLTGIINNFIPVELPKIGSDREHRKNMWTFYLGDWSHIALPWILVLFWGWLSVALHHDWQQLW